MWRGFLCWLFIEEIEVFMVLLGDSLLPDFFARFGFDSLVDLEECQGHRLGAFVG